VQHRIEAAGFTSILRLEAAGAPSTGSGLAGLLSSAVGAL
jgi:hypothetical protein